MASEQEVFDVVVVGAGAAGLVAAWRARARGASTLLLERNARAGVKILASGGGRCNVTTTREGDALLRSFPDDQRRFLRFAFGAFPPRRLRELLEGLGVPLQEEEYEKVFPAAGRARVVRDALLANAEHVGVEVRYDFRLAAVERGPDEFIVRSESGDVARTKTVVLAMGGKSYPKTGTTGDGYPILSRLGHTVTPCYPALVGVCVADEDVVSLSGLTLEDAAVSVRIDECPVVSVRRPLLFTHRGLSGPSAMDVSRWVAPRNRTTLYVDLFPGQTAKELDRWLLDAMAAHPKRTLASLPGIPRRAGELALRRGGVEPETPVNGLTRGTREAVVAALKRVQLTATGTLGFDKAEVTTGGVALDEISPRSMESRIVSGLFVVGELLDVDGPIGGFNFQAAFATGYLGGEGAAKRAQAVR